MNGGSVLLDVFTTSAFAERQETHDHGSRFMNGFWAPGESACPVTPLKQAHLVLKQLEKISSFLDIVNILIPCFTLSIGANPKTPETPPSVDAQQLKPLIPMRR